MDTPPAKTAEAESIPCRPDESGGTWALLRRRPVRLLFVARSTSVLGDMVAPVALAFAVLSLGGGATGLGLVLAARALPSVLLVLVGGLLGDRYPRRMVMAWSNLAGFFTQALCGALILLHHAPIWSIALLAAMRGATGAFFNPASTGSIADVAPPGRLQSTYSLFSLAGNAAEILGPTLAGILLTVVDPGWLLLADAATFFVSALLITAIGPMGTGTSAARGPLGREALEGLRCVLQKRWLASIIASACVFQLFLLASLNVLGPLVADDRLGGASAWAVLVTALGGGGLCGTVISLRIRPAHPLRVGYLLMIAGSGPTLLLLALPAPLPVIAASEFVSGFTIAVFTAIESAAIAREVPRELLSRVDAVNRFGSMSLRPLGMAMVGPLAALMGTSTTLVVAASVSLLAMLAPLLVGEVRGMTG